MISHYTIVNSYNGSWRVFLFWLFSEPERSFTWNMMTSSLIILLVLVYFSSCESTNLTQCHKGYQCSLTSITSFGNIECDGYHSCAKAIEITTIGDIDRQINCYGSFSCYQAKTIQVNNTAVNPLSNDIFCMYINLILFY